MDWYNQHRNRIRQSQSYRHIKSLISQEILWNDTERLGMFICELITLFLFYCCHLKSEAVSEVLKCSLFWGKCHCSFLPCLEGGGQAMLLLHGTVTGTAQATAPLTGLIQSRWHRQRLEINPKSLQLSPSFQGATCKPWVQTPRESTSEWWGISLFTPFCSPVTFQHFNATWTR